MSHVTDIVRQTYNVRQTWSNRHGQLWLQSQTVMAKLTYMVRQTWWSERHGQTDVYDQTDMVRKIYLVRQT